MNLYKNASGKYKKQVLKSMKVNKKYNVVIVGGGLSGLSLACLLARHDLSIACIDQADPKTKPKDLRTTAISFGSRKVLERAGVWDNVKDACSIKDIQILDGRSSVLLEFLSEQAGNKDFGWIVDNHDLKTAMMKQLKTLKNVTHIAPMGVTGFEVSEDKAAVVLSDGKTVEADLIIGADGRKSSVRGFMEHQYGIRSRQWSYNQRAVICMTEHEHPHNNVAVEHFWPEGPFAILPFTDDSKGVHRSAVVFTEHGPEKTSLMKMTDEEFEMALAARFPESYGEVKLSGSRAAYPLNLVHAEKYTAPNMLLVADAAHGIHPIAGQGLNLGFRDLDCLDQLIEEALRTGESIASNAILKTYEQKRRPDNMAMVAMTDGLNRLFSNGSPTVSFLRKAGLKMVSRINPAKRFFMKQAMGDR